jgi:signal transduction histidine kinase
VLVTPDFETIQLSEMINSVTDQMLKASGIDTHIDTKYFQEEWLKDEQKLAIYRIAQEQCSNIVKYAEAKLVNISLSMRAGIFTMRISDNGKGMEDSAKIVKGIGLKNIKSRLSILNGGAKITTSPGKGFLLEIKMPYEK